jgi:UDP-2,3-diacylglucosamine pyrophosphatase LpxH
MAAAGGLQTPSVPVRVEAMALLQPIRILSDLHLAHPASLVKNVQQLEPLLEGAKTVVFNGDTAELRLGSARPTAERYLEAIRSLCRRWGIEPVFINGNHDPDASGHNHLELCGGRLLITHGDVLFPEVTPWGREAGQLKVHQQKALQEEAGNEPPELEHLLNAAKTASIRTRTEDGRMPRSNREWVRAIFTETAHPARAYQVLRAWATAPTRAVDLMTEHRPEARWIVLGHTHLPGKWQRGDRVVLNTGAFLPWFGRRVIEVADGRISMCRVRSDGKHFHRGKELYQDSLATPVPGPDLSPDKVAVYRK